MPEDVLAVTRSEVQSPHQIQHLVVSVERVSQFVQKAGEALGLFERAQLAIADALVARAAGGIGRSLSGVEVAVHRDYSLRAIKESNDETGQVIDRFNEMLSQIQARDLALLWSANQRTPPTCSGRVVGAFRAWAEARVLKITGRLPALKTLQAGIRAASHGSPLGWKTPRGL